MSSEKGLLYYLHESIYLSKAFGFSTIPRGCMPHLSHYRDPSVCEENWERGQAAGAEGKARLFTPKVGRSQMGPLKCQACSS